MAGHGPPPKDADRRARGNRSNKVDILRVVHQAQKVEPLTLPAGEDWHPQTIRWYQTWIDSPLSEHFTSTDWQYLLETAFIQNRFWAGNMQVAGELRLRAAKFGATPEDRARLRIQVVTADEAEAKAEAKASVPTSRGRYNSPQVG
jgi:hypothetical protein